MKAKPSITDDTVMKPQAVADWLQVKPRQLDRLGVPCLPLSHKIKRYFKADVLTWLQQQRKEG